MRGMWPGILPGASLGLLGERRSKQVFAGKSVTMYQASASSASGISYHLLSKMPEHF